MPLLIHFYNGDVDVCVPNYVLGVKPRNEARLDQHRTIRWIIFLIISLPDTKQGVNAAKMQVVTGNERELFDSLREERTINEQDLRLSVVEKQEMGR